MRRAERELVRDLVIALIATARPTEGARELFARAEAALRPARKARSIRTSPKRSIVAPAPAQALMAVIPEPEAEIDVPVFPRGSDVALPAPEPEPVDPRRWSKPCKAVSAETGRCCALLQGHVLPHRHGPVAFLRKAVPGQTFFAAAAELEALAFSRPESMVEEAGHEARRYADRQTKKTARAGAPNTDSLRGK